MSAAKVEFSEEKAKTNNEMEELQGEFEKAFTATAALETEVNELRNAYIEKAEVRATVLYCSNQRHHDCH